MNIMDMRKNLIINVVFCTLCINLTSRAQVDLPIMVDFTNFSGINLSEIAPGWQEAKGIGNPNDFGNGGWFRADVIHPQITAGVFINSNTHAEWMISPKFTTTEHTKLSFKAALTLLWDELAQTSLAFDDSLAIMYSYNGTTFFPTGFTFKYGNEPGINLEIYDVDLSSFAGEDIHIAFYATDGHIANSLAVFHIADIVIKNTNSKDAAITKIIAPNRYQCLSESSTILVELKNDGHETIYSIPVRGKVRGVMNENYYGVYFGELLPNETALFTIEGVDLSSFGEYEVTVITELIDDGDTSNNTLSTGKFINFEPLTLPLQTLTFTDFYSDNLSIIYPGWYEARGKGFPFVQTNTDWQGDFFAGSRTASVYFIALGTNDWIISPKFTATANSIIEIKAAVEFDQGTTQMGSDDKLAIMVSNNCGESWTEIGAIDKNSGLGDTFLDFSYSLSDFAGEDLIIGLYATTNQVNDPQSYILHIDDVALRNQYTYDAGVIGLLSPFGSCSFGLDEVLTVLVRNFGTEPIANFEVGYSLNDEDFVFENLTQTIEPFEALEFSFDGTLNLSGSQSNTLGVKTLLDNDEYSGNDLMYFTVNTNSFDFETQGVYRMGFEENEDFSNWVVINVNNDGHEWEIEHDPVHAHEGEYSMAYFSNNSTVTSNDWLISPCFYFKAGTEYSVSFWYKNRASAYPEMLKLMLGTSQSAASMTTVLVDLGEISNSAYFKSSILFTVPSDGEYYFGWQAYGPANRFGMHIDLVEVYQIFDYDLALTDIDIRRIKDDSCILINSNKIAVNVKNFGNQTVDEISIGVQVDGDEIVVADFIHTLVQNEETILLVEHSDISIPANQTSTIKVWINIPDDLNVANDSIILWEYDMNLYTMGFEEIEDSSEWTTEDLSGGFSWNRINDPSVARTGSYSYGIRTDGASGNTSNNDWLFSECFYLDAEKAYTLTFYYRSRFSYENLNVYIGDSNTASAMETEIFSDQNFYSNSYIKAEIGITVDQSGSYHFGWHTLSGTSQKYYIYIDDILLEETCHSAEIISALGLVLDKEALFFADAPYAIDYNWDFGDENQSTEQNPSHIYAENGVYSINLVVSNACSQAEISFEIEVNCQKPIADFTFEADEGVVQFITETEAVGYEWNFGDGNYSNLQNPLHTYIESGFYDVVMQAFDACGFDFMQKQVEVSILKIESLPIGSILIFPNPTADKLNVISDIETIASISIYTINGSLLKQIANSKGIKSAVIDVSKLSQGLYIVNVKTDKAQRVLRFTKH